MGQRNKIFRVLWLFRLRRVYIHLGLVFRRAHCLQCRSRLFARFPQLPPNLNRNNSQPLFCLDRRRQLPPLLLYRRKFNNRRQLRFLARRLVQRLLPLLVV
jgi:hypothetical protein